MCFFCMHPVIVCVFLLPCYWGYWCLHIAPAALIKPGIHMPTYICMININMPASDCCSLLTQQAAEIYLFFSIAQSPGCYEYERNDGYLNVNRASWCSAGSLAVRLQLQASVRVSENWTFQRVQQDKCYFVK